MRWSLPPLLVFLALTLPSGSAPGATPPGPGAVSLPADPAGQQLKAWLAAFNSGERAQLKKVHAGHQNAERRVNMDLSMAEATGGLQLYQIESASPIEISVLVQEKKTKRWTRVALKVEAAAPHAIAGIRLEPADPPAGTPEAAASALDAKARAAIVEALSRELNRAYIFAEKAAAMETDLRRRLREGEYDRTSGPAELAKVLTEHLQAISHDKHLRVWRDAGPPRSPGRRGPAPHLFGPSRRLEGNVAYVEINTFGAPPERVRDEVRSVMSAAADAAALILNLRGNGGGDPATVALVTSYLFGGEAVHLNTMYWRAENRTDQFFTNPQVAGTRFGPDKPIYVLVSKRTFSGAEEFAYNLKALGRGTIVGETTGGGAHPGGVVPLPHGLGVFVPGGRAINPITKTNWEGTGVAPDVAVQADKALDTAHQLAQSRLKDHGQLRKAAAR